MPYLLADFRLDDFCQIIKIPGFLASNERPLSPLLGFWNDGTGCHSRDIDALDLRSLTRLACDIVVNGHFNEVISSLRGLNDVESKAE